MTEDELVVALADHLALLRVIGAAVRMGCTLVRVEADFGCPPLTKLTIRGPEVPRRRLAAYAARVQTIYEEKA
jgi:hypothetical protein